MIKPTTIPALQPLLATRARQRMAVVAVTAALYSLFSAGIEIVLPLWATREMQVSAQEWANLRSLRFAGVFVGVVLLGALSDRFGQRLVGAISMFGTAVLLILMSFGGKSSLWLIMPVFGTLVSTAFVNMNTLTQQVSDARQGVANTIYRSIGAAAGIAAPVAVTALALAWHGYPRVMLLCAGLLIAAGFVVMRYPGEAVPPPAGSLRAEVARLWDGYRTALRQRELMLFLAVSLLWGNLLAGVGAFAAIRFTQELGQSDQRFGLISTIAGVASLAVTILAGFYLDRISLRKLHGVIALIVSGCSILMGLGNSVLLTSAGFVGFLPLTTMLVGPTSMWVSRAAGAGTQGAAFSVQKVAAALVVAIAMAAVGALEELIGMRHIILYGGILAAVAGLLFFALKEPARTGQRG